MLILTRRVGETLMIGDQVSVTVLGVKGNQVRIGVNAPKEVAVHREEIYQRIQHERTGYDYPNGYAQSYAQPNHEESNFQPQGYPQLERMPNPANSYPNGFNPQNNPAPRVEQDQYAQRSAREVGRHDNSNTLGFNRSTPPVRPYPYPNTHPDYPSNASQFNEGMKHRVPHPNGSTQQSDEEFNAPDDDRYSGFFNR